MISNLVMHTNNKIYFIYFVKNNITYIINSKGGNNK